MLNKEELLEQTGETLEYARQFINKKIDLLQLETAERSAKATASLVTIGSIAILSLFLLLMLSIAFAFAIAQFLQSYALGFLLVSLLYAFALVGIYIFKQQLITNPILSFILNAFFDDDDEEEDEE